MTEKCKQLEQLKLFAKMTGKQGTFDLEIVIKGFEECQDRNDGLDLEQYVVAFTELCR